MIAQRRRSFTEHRVRSVKCSPNCRRALFWARAVHFSGLEFALCVPYAGHRGDKQSRRSRPSLVRLRRAPDSEGYQPRRSQRQGGRHHGSVRLRKDDPAPADRRGAFPGRGRNPCGRPRREQAQRCRAFCAAAQDGDAVPVRSPVYRYVLVRQRGVPDARAHRLAGADDPRSRAHEVSGGGPARGRGSHARGKGRVSRYARRGARGGTRVPPPVRLWRTRWAGPVSLSGAGISAGSVRAMIARIAELVRALGARIVNNWIWRLGFACRFLWFTLKESGASFRRFHLTIREIYFTGVLSLIIILVSGLFVGMVLALQGYDTLVRFGSSEVLGVLVSLSLVRELGPVVAGLLFASRAGSAITAEIGLMKATEQLAAMEMMAVDPIARVVAPRFWAGVISMPVLAALFSAMGVFGGYLVGVRLIGVDEGSFWSQMQASVDFREDVLNGVIKSLVFGIAVTWIAVYEGYDAPPTAEGVSGATTRTVVTSSLAILALDFVLTALMFRGH